MNVYKFWILSTYTGAGGPILQRYLIYNKNSAANNSNDFKNVLFFNNYHWITICWSNNIIWNGQSDPGRCPALTQLISQLNLTHWGLVTPFGDRDLGQNWLSLWLLAWWHQTITWTNVDWSSLKSSDIHIRAISQEMPEPSITKISLKIIYLKFYSNLPGANELKTTKSVERGMLHNAASHDPSQYWLIVNWTLRNIIQWNLNQNITIFKKIFKEISLKMLTANWLSFCLGPNMLTSISLT